ncbi:MAG: DciA family protein [Candidatus Omnitrophota bacterium]
MDKIKEVVNGVMGDWAVQKEGAGPDAPQAWLKKVLTKKELEHIKFNYFKKGVLGVWVDSSTWLYSFHLKKTKLLDKLHKVASGVQDIRFRIGVTQ